MERATGEKASYLVVYDYGMGGVWAIIRARSAEEIGQKYPMLTVRNDRPEWMSNEYYKQVVSQRFYDIDEEPTGWLLSVMLSQ